MNTNNDLYDFTQQKYKEIHKEIYSENFNFNPYKHKRILLKFFTLLENNFTTIGEFLINDFLEFTFNFYFIAAKNNVFEGKIDPMWVFSTKNIERYKAKKNNYRFAIQKNLKSLKVKNVVLETMKLENMSFEDKYKQIAYDKPDGIIVCLQFTTLFSNKSEFCKVCCNKEICKEKQKEIYPKLHLKNERENI